MACRKARFWKHIRFNVERNRLPTGARIALRWCCGYLLLRAEYKAEMEVRNAGSFLCNRSAGHHLSSLLTVFADRAEL